METGPLPDWFAKNQARRLISAALSCDCPGFSRTSGFHSEPATMNEGIRLNRYLAACEVGSRRACDELIRAGRVALNEVPVTDLATRVQPGDRVQLDGKTVTPKAPAVIILHKPRGLVCSRRDELGRPTIYDLLPRHLQGLRHVGRLDLDSEGLLALTNDGALAQSLMHPSREVEKEYHVTANQAFESEHLAQFLTGVHTPETGRLVAKEVERLSPRRVRMVLQHGAKRQIRLMFEALGYRVTKLLRVRIGQLWLGDLQPGEWATLKPLEIAMLLGGPAPAAATRRPDRRERAKTAKASKTAKSAEPPPRKQNKGRHGKSPAPASGNKTASGGRSKTSSAAAAPRGAKQAPRKSASGASAGHGKSRSGATPPGPPRSRKSAPGAGGKFPLGRGRKGG